MLVILVLLSKELQLFLHVLDKFLVVVNFLDQLHQWLWKFLHGGTSLVFFWSFQVELCLGTIYSLFHSTFVRTLLSQFELSLFLSFFHHLIDLLIKVLYQFDKLSFLFLNIQVLLFVVHDRPFDLLHQRLKESFFVWLKHLNWRMSNFGIFNLEAVVAWYLASLQIIPSLQMIALYSFRKLSLYGRLF